MIGKDLERELLDIEIWPTVYGTGARSPTPLLLGCRQGGAITPRLWNDTTDHALRGHQRPEPEPGAVRSETRGAAGRSCPDPTVPGRSRRVHVGRSWCVCAPCRRLVSPSDQWAGRATGQCPELRPMGGQGSDQCRAVSTNGGSGQFRAGSYTVVSGRYWSVLHIK